MERTARRLNLFEPHRNRTSNPVPRCTMLKKVLLGCGIASSVLYIASDVLATLRYDGYSYLDQTFSELLAAGAPTRPLMVLLGGSAYTVLVTAFGVGVWMVGGNRTARLTGALLVGYALVGAVAGVLFRMNTREVLAAAQDDWRNAGHAPGTAVQSLVLMLAMAIGARLLGKWFRWYSYGTIATLLVFGILTSLQIGAMTANEPTPWMGLEERANIYATMLWIAVLSAGLLRAQEAMAPRHLEKPSVIPHILPR
jgi:hypothetical protein